MEKELQVFCKQFSDLTVSDLMLIMSGEATTNLELKHEVQLFASLKKEIDAWLGSEPQYANFYRFFDKLLARRMPFKHAFAASQVYCESRGYEIPLRYLARRRMRAGK